MSIILRRAPSMAHGGLVAGKKTSSNRTVCAAPAVAGLASEKHQSGYALCGVFLRHIFLRPETATQFLYRAQKNVAYSRNVMCNLSPPFLKKKYCKMYEIMLSFVKEILRKDEKN
jgi:hypothetical protein